MMSGSFTEAGPGMACRSFFLLMARAIAYGDSIPRLPLLGWNECDFITSACDVREHRDLFAAWRQRLACGAVCTWDALVQRARASITRHQLAAGFNFDGLDRGPASNLAAALPPIPRTFSRTWCFPALTLALFVLAYTNVEPFVFVLLNNSLITPHNELGLRLVDAAYKQCAEPPRAFLQPFFDAFGVSPSQLQYGFWQQNVVLEFIGSGQGVPHPPPDFPCTMHRQRAHGSIAWTDSVAADVASPHDGRVPVVVDVGCYLGLDILFYLALGYKVIAVDGNARVVRQVLQDFASYVELGVLQVVHAAVVEDLPAEAALGRKSALAPFCARYPDTPNRSMSESHVLPPRMECDGELQYAPVATCRQLLERFARPVYIKVDIESSDLACLRSLPRLGERGPRLPTFISIEVGGGMRLANMVRNAVRELSLRNYDGFRLVAQSLFSPVLRSLGGGTGPFGDDASDALHGAVWRSADALLVDVPRYVLTRPGDWWDLHARLRQHG